MPETHPAPDPIPIRPRLRRQSPNLRELRTEKTRTLGSMDVLPRLLTSLQAMWLLDLRERPEESGRRPQQDHRTKKGSSQTECQSYGPNPPICQPESSLILSLASLASRGSTTLEIHRN